MTTNILLSSLLPEDLALIERSLEVVDLPFQRKLELRGYPIKDFYFLESGLASVVVTAGVTQSLEVGVIGKEGMTGLFALFGADKSHHETFMQTAGHGRSIAVSKLRQAMEQSATLQDALFRYAQTFILQMSYTALANGRYQLEQRLARWLLMAADRMEEPSVRLTHDSLAVMLGTRRAGVTVALGELHKRGIIQLSRGVINVIDRNALVEAANGIYGIPEAEYCRLLGRDRRISGNKYKNDEQSFPSVN
jgi:CRP-like cAMP-binding protein